MSLNDYIFGPLDIEYCAYFYILSVISYLIFLSILLSLAYYLITGSKKVDSKLAMTMVFGSLVYGVMYFQSRLLHSMCVKSEKMTDFEGLGGHGGGNHKKKRKN
jgi:hypothetical protein